LPQGVVNRADQISSALEAPERTQFNESTLPKVREAYGGGGSYWGGARAKAEATASRDFEQALNAQRAQILLGMQQQGTQNILQALPMMSSLSTYENPYYTQLLQALQGAMGLGTANLQENVITPWQNQNVSWI